jgi:hypothetical protein
MGKSPSRTRQINAKRLVAVRRFDVLIGLPQEKRPVGWTF